MYNIKVLKIWRVVRAGRRSTIGNRVYVNSVPGVRISPSPPGYFKGHTAKYVLFFFYFLVSSMSSALVIYGSISLGQMFSKHKVMGSVLCYIGVTILIQTVTSFAMTPYLTKIVITNRSVSIGPGIPDFMGSFMRNTFIFSFIASVVTGAACYVLSEYLMKKQLNLD